MKRKVEVMDLQTEKLKEELDEERVKMDEEWEELRQKQKLISDMMTVVRKSRVASIDEKQTNKKSETPEDSDSDS